MWGNLWRARAKVKARADGGSNALVNRCSNSHLLVLVNMFFLKAKTLQQLNEAIDDCIKQIKEKYIKVLKQHGGYKDDFYYARIDISDKEMLMPIGIEADSAYQINNTRLN